MLCMVKLRFLVSGLPVALLLNPMGDAADAPMLVSLDLFRMYGEYRLSHTIVFPKPKLAVQHFVATTVESLDTLDLLSLFC